MLRWGRHLCVTAGLLILALAAPQTGLATPVTVYFSGTATVTDPYHMLPEGVVSGGSFFGSFVFDTQDDFSMIAWQPSHATTATPTGVSLFMGGQAFTPTSSTQSDLTLLENVPPSATSSGLLPAPQGDYVVAQSQYLSFPALTGYPALHASDYVASILLSGFDPSGQMFSLAHLADGFSYHPDQTMSFQLQVFNPYQAFVNVYPGQPSLGYSITGKIDNLFTLGANPLTASPPAAFVPEPSTSILLTLAALSLLARRWVLKVR
jgi:hypothetical protein